MIRSDQLVPDRAMVLVIDAQEKLMPLVRGGSHVVRYLSKLIEGARVFDLPMLVTEQYPQGLGPTVEPVATRLQEAGAKFLQKLTFSAWTHPPIRSALLETDRPQVILAGVEAHVCVQQTALDLLSRDYDVYVCADAVGSRGRMNYKCALARMRQSGAWVTTVESVLFELCQRCDTKQFKALLDVIKRTPPQDDDQDD